MSVTSKHYGLRATSLLATLGGLLFTATAMACPNCVLEQQTRAEIWRDDFEWYLCVAVLPFLLVGVICLRAESMDEAP